MRFGAPLGTPGDTFLQDFQYFLEHVFGEAPTSTFEEDFALILDYLFVTCLIGFANGLKTEKHHLLLLFTIL